MYIKRILAFVILNSACLIASHAQAPMLYGMTSSGGTNSYGTIISFNPATDSEKVLWNFSHLTDGNNPQQGTFVYDTTNGLFYAMTYGGGNADAGAIISFNPYMGRDSMLYSFGQSKVSQYPLSASFFFDAANGLYYGTGAGGKCDDGAIFTFNPTTSAVNLLYSMGCTSYDAGNNGGPLVLNSGNGLLYGMAAQGGKCDDGVIYTFNTATNKDSVVWNFGCGADGNTPRGSLVYNSSDGLYYGLTTHGGANAGPFFTLGGIIFSFNAANDSEKVLWNFGNGGDGNTPYGSLVYDADNGLYYGTTQYGGDGNIGTIFSFDPNTNSEKVVWNFGDNGRYDGVQPTGDLVYDAGNKLFYGMTEFGGIYPTVHGGGGGIIFSFNPADDSEKILRSLGNGTDGEYPYGSLMLFTAPCHAAFNLVPDGSQRGLYHGYNNSTGANLQYLWYFGDGDTSTEQYPTHFYTDSGFYNICLTVTGNSDCTSTYCDSMFFIARTEGGNPIHEITFQQVPTGASSSAVVTNYIQVVPNPSNGIFSLTGLHTGEIIELYNYLGQEVFQLKTQNTKQEVNVSSLADGIYLMRVMDADGSVACEKKVIKIQ